MRTASGGVVGAIVVAAVVVACGGASGGGQVPGGASCPKPEGAYVVTSELLDGDCGLPRRRQEIMVMSQGAEPGCRSIDGRATPTPEGCVYEETQICDRPGTKVTASVRLAVPEGAKEMKGTAAYMLEAGSTRCLSRYSVRYVKNAP